MAKKMIHLVLFAYGDGDVEAHVFGTHNERDELLEDAREQWLICGGSKEHEPFKPLDLMVPINIGPKQLTLALLVMGALVLRCDQLAIGFHSNF